MNNNNDENENEKNCLFNHIRNINYTNTKITIMTLVVMMVSTITTVIRSITRFGISMRITIKAIIFITSTINHIIRLMLLTNSVML